MHCQTCAATCNAHTAALSISAASLSCAGLAVVTNKWLTARRMYALQLAKRFDNVRVYMFNPREQWQDPYRAHPASLSRRQWSLQWRARG